MNLLTSLIENKLLKFDEDFANNQSNFWDFYQAFNLVCQPLERNLLWKKVIGGDEKAILQMRMLVYQDRKLLYEYLTDLRKEEGKEAKMGNLWKPGRFAVLDYEYG